MREITVKVHEVATDGLPDMEALVGRVALIFDGCIVSGWPVDFGDTEGGGRGWEADRDVGNHLRFGGVTHWVEFPEALHVIAPLGPSEEAP